MCEKSLIRTLHHHHHGWDNALPPQIRIAAGQQIEFACKDSGNGHFTARSTAEDVLSMPFDNINPVTGPVYIEGAEPGDILKVTIDSFEPSGFGWTANIPDFGLLADQFKTPSLATWQYAPDLRKPAAFGDWARVPLKPFAGTIGVAPAEDGLHSVVPPRRVGGNLDIRDLNAGSVLYLPVEVSGALLSVGDTHAAQGDGEVCGTAIESAMNVVVTLDVLKGQSLNYPRFSTAGPVTRHLDTLGYEVATGIGPDLIQCAREAVSETINWLGRTRNMPADQAYMLCSVCGDLRISEIVDRPNWVVSFYFPRVVLD